jgi:hypothetical protein
MPPWAGKRGNPGPEKTDRLTRGFTRATALAFKYRETTEFWKNFYREVEKVSVQNLVFSFFSTLAT